jgi:hypothetical protein
MAIPIEAERYFTELADYWTPYGMAEDIAEERKLWTRLWEQGGALEFMYNQLLIMREQIPISERQVKIVELCKARTA